MTRTWFFLLCGMMPAMAGEMPEKAAGYHEALRKRPDSEALFTRFRDAWLEEKPAGDLETELLSRAEAGEPGAWGILGRAQLAAGKEDEALASFGKAIEAEPAAAWLRLARGKMLLAKKDFAAAEKDALAVPEGDKLRPEALKLAGLACLRGERVEAALAHWKKAVESAPGDKSLLEDLTELARREGRYDLALDFCVKWRDATEDAYGKAMATLKRSELLFASQRFEEAMGELGEVLKASGDGSWLEREALGRAEQTFQRQGDATGWVKQIGTWAEANPVRLNFRRAQANALSAAGQPAQALGVLDQVLKRVPGDREARWQRISLLERDLKVQQAFEECAVLAAEEKSEETGLRLAELAFRLDKKDEVKKALDAVIAAADPAKHVGLAGLYARYGLPAESEKQWRAAAGGESGGQALRELAKFLRAEAREKDALEVWKEIGKRDHSQDRIDAAAALAGAGEREAARALLEEGREKFSKEAGYEAARADLAMMQDRQPEAQAIFRELAVRAQRPDEMQTAVKGWLRVVAVRGEEAVKELGESTGDRCLRAAWLAEADKPLPALVAGDELERSMRLALLREYRKWPEVVALLEASGGSGPLFLSELCDAKFSAGDQPGALAAAKAWRERTPDQPGPWLKEADLLADSGNATEAEALLRRAVARFESDENVARALFSLLEKNRGMVAALDLAWQRHDQGADAAAKAGWLREIIRVSKNGQGMEDLKERFEERARRDPASPGPLLALADLARNSGDTREELALMTKAVACAPRDVAIVSKLAALEEQMGWRDRALQRYTELARLVPGVDSARQLAQAKLRCGDVAGGMRDLQALAGDKGIDVRKLENSAISLAVRGYVEESIELLGALDPARFDARLHFVLGTLLEADGREVEAFDHFLKVWQEPDDPAELESHGQGWERGGALGLAALVDMQRYQPSQEYGVLQQVPVAGSLAQAKMQLPARLVRMATRSGGHLWEQVCVAIPELRAGSIDQWLEVRKFASEGSGGGYSANWWAFVQRFPDNPLGLEMLYATQQHIRGTAEQKEALLRREPAVPLKIALPLRLSEEVTEETVAWLEKLEPAAWQDDRTYQLVMALPNRALMFMEREEKPDPALAGRVERLLVMLEKGNPAGDRLAKVKYLRARQALAAGQVDAFLAGLKETLEIPFDSELERGHGSSVTSVSPTVVDTLVVPLANFRKRKGDAAANELIERLPSPVLRCIAVQDGGIKDRDACHKRAVKELAALPADAPRDLRRDLIRLSWRIAGRTPQAKEEARKQLRAAAMDDSDPRLALEAFFTLGMQWGESDGGEFSPADRQRMESLAKRLNLSDESDRRFAAWVGLTFHQQVSRTPAVTRWGSVSGSGYGYGYGGGIGNNGTMTTRIVSLKKDQRPAAVQEAANLLESTARGSMGQVEQLSRLVIDFKKAGLLDDALAKIVLPENAGLTRKVAMRVLMDAADRPAAAREIIAGIQRQRPWESYWLLELALRSEDREECFRLLDEAAALPEFSRLLVSRNIDRGFEGRAADGSGMAKMVMLADWAERPTSIRDWLGPATVSLGSRIGTSEKPLQDVMGIYQRYCKLALADPQSSEMAFGSLYLTTLTRDPAAVDDAARQVLLSGAYAITGEKGQPHGFSRGSPSQAPAAISHLMTEAAEKGDEAIFPADFREKLKVVDPAFDTWLGTLLTTKRATDLPDVFREQTGAQFGVELRKHEAALIRASQLPGREELLMKVFKEQKQQPVSGSFVQIIRASLAAATKEKALEKRLLLLLEASAGPRKDWKWPENYQLTSTCGLILQAAGQTDSATVVGVVKCFASWKVMGYQQMDVSQSLASLWRKELEDPKVKWDALPGTSPRDALYIGYWQAQPDQDGKATGMQFRWTFPQAVQSVRGSEKELFAQVAANPKASFIDLMRAAAFSNDRSLYKRALKLIEPELAKLPAEMREGVIDTFVRRLGKEDAEGLSKTVVARLDKRLAQEKTERIRSTREMLKIMQTSPGSVGNQDHMCGELIGKILPDDPQLATEIQEFWLSKSPRNDDAFAMAMLINTNGVEQIFDKLSYLDKLWKGEPPPLKLANRGSEPFTAVWNRIEGKSYFQPVVWDRIAGLSPRMQVRLLFAGSQHFRIGGNQGLPPDLSPLAKKSELLRHAHAWYGEKGKFSRDSGARGDGALLLAYARSLAKSGADEALLAGFLGEEMRYLPRLENAEAILKETPELLAGIQSLPVESVQSFASAVNALWNAKRQEWRKMSPVLPEAQANPPVYPEATASFLKFILSKGAVGRGGEVPGGYGMTKIVLDTGDGELLERWIARGGSNLAGDMALVIQLLKTGRVKQAAALAAGPGAPFSGSQPFTKEIEQLVKKLEAEDSPQAFRLRAAMSLWFDARGAEAPEEPLEARRERLGAELDKRAADLPVKDRMVLCVYLGLPKKGALGPVPSLDEFAGETYAREFSDRLRAQIKGDSNDPVGPLHVAAVCSRFHAGDTAGMEKLIELFEETLGEGAVAWEMSQNWLPMIQVCFWSYADRHDAVLPEASSKVMLKMADMLAKFERQDWRTAAVMMVRLASKTPEAATATLEAAKLQAVDPRNRFYLNDQIDREAVVRSMMRVSLLKSADSSELLKGFFTQGMISASKDGLVDLLGDPKVRARLQPADFVAWLGKVHRVSPESFASAMTYAEERKADFNEEQRQGWETIRTRLQNTAPARREAPRLPVPMDPDRR